MIDDHDTPAGTRTPRDFARAMQGMEAGAAVIEMLKLYPAVEVLAAIPPGCAVADRLAKLMHPDLDAVAALANLLQVVGYEALLAALADPTPAGGALEQPLMPWQESARADAATIMPTKALPGNTWAAAMAAIGGHPGGGVL